MKILAYRTLEQEKVVKKVLGYKKPETPATIPGWKRAVVPGDPGKEGYDTLYPDEKSSVQGSILDCTDDEVKKLEKWESRYTLKNIGNNVFAFIYGSGNTPEDTEEPDDGETDDDVLTEALQRFEDIRTSFESVRIDAVDDIKFAFRKDGQWASDLTKLRKDENRPWFSINKLPAFCYKVVNKMRKDQSSIKIRPANSDTDVGNAQVIDGLVRSIMNNGNSSAALDNARFYQVVGGFGFFRVATQYTEPDSFDQEIIIETIENPMSVYFPLHLINKLDYSDAPYCFIRVKMSRDDFKRQYPDVEMGDFEEHDTGDDQWAESDAIFVAEYFVVKEKEKTLYLLSDGTTVIDSSEPDLEKGVTIIKTRSTIEREVWRYLMTRNNILEKQKLDGKYIPIVPILGQQVILDGEKAYISLVRFAKDPQKIYNYMHTAYVETMSQAPKAPFLVAAESDVTKYDEWKSLNTKSHAYLRYRATDDMGNPLPAPIRMQPPDASQAAVMGLQISDNNLRDVTGIAQAQLGQQSNEVSGVAIDARTEEGDENIYHFLANNNNALLYLAHILVDLIPYVYDVPRAIRILGEDMVQKIVWINQEDGNSKNPDGKLYNVTVGKYDVVMDTGPRFETRRMETANAMFKLINSVPQFGQVTADQLIGMLDFPQAEQVAQRYRAFINQTYPNLIPVDDNGLLSTPDQLKAMLQQAQGVITQNAQQAQAMKQVIQQLQGELTQMKVQLIDKTAEHQLRMSEAQIRAATETKKAELNLEATRIKTGADVNMHTLDSGIAIHTAHLPALSDMAQPPGGQPVQQFNQGVSPNV